MRDIKQLHPRLQEIIPKLKAECKEAGITIGISECLRTVDEQNALYAKGRTAAGSIVTNCKGTSYSSMHQWGVAFDFYLDMDIDKDGKKSDDAYNNSKKTFQKVGSIGKKLGLEWGGNWISPVDLPHFQLKDWGSTATKLKNQYGTPDKFFATWEKKEDKEEKKTTTSASEKKTTTKSKKLESAKEYDKKLAKTYKTTGQLNLRLGAGSNKAIVTVIPKGKKVQCFGYYTEKNGTKWLLVQYSKYTGFCSKKYLK